MELAMAILSAVSAAAAALAAFFTYYNSKKTGNGNVELQIRSMIFEAKHRQFEVMIKLVENPNEKRFKIITDALTEDILNAYDEACAKYNDRKVDRERFKKMYFHEIGQLVENFPDKYNSVTTRFKATLTVYQEWYSQKG